MDSPTSASAGVYVRDATSGRYLLVDTGASRSIFPPTQSDKNRPSSYTGGLTAANGSRIDCFGIKTQTISFLNRTFTWPFLIADVRTPLLGADFLAHHGLLIDVAGRRLIDIDALKSCPLSTGPKLQTVYAVAPDEYECLQKEFPEVFKPELRQQPGTTAKHGIYHHITTKGPPTRCKFRRLTPHIQREAKRACQDMERMGIC